LADTNTKRSPHLEQILDRSRPRHEPEVEGAQKSLKESRPAIPTPMLDVIFRDGRVRSFSYAYLAEVEFEPGDKLTLRFSNGAVVVAEGRGLERHRQQVRLHRADEIGESSESELELQEDGISQIESITITQGETL
jgi:hypothetical protein